MATLSEQIITVNNLGRNNLAEKGIIIDETATTYEIMQSIANAPKTPATNVQVDSCVAQVISPVVLDTVMAEINSGTVQTDSSVSLEE